ncbi:hypothetical protein IPL68_03270 [Candidatus Saccharibacteria bacterium]|nr:MAG: hypothetical protein IPL68_03270 [Candidatus Saccharibacteria bacterium]
MFGLSIPLTILWEKVYTYLYEIGGEDKQLHYYRLSPAEVLKQVQSNEQGLSAHEAAERYEQLGANVLAVKKKEWWGISYARQFRDFMILLLLASAGLAFYLGDNRAGTVLLALVFFNTAIGFCRSLKLKTHRITRKTSSRQGKSPACR